MNIDIDENSAFHAKDIMIRSRLSASYISPSIDSISISTKYTCKLIVLKLFILKIWPGEGWTLPGLLYPRYVMHKWIPTETYRESCTASDLMTIPGQVTDNDDWRYVNLLYRYLLSLADGDSLA